MKTLKTLLVAALLSVGCAAQAQDADYTFKKHAYLQLQGGAQYTLGEAKFGDLISPNVQAALGYQFSPVFGARLAVNAWQSKGGYNGYQVSDGANPGNIQYKYKYVAPTIDFMFNLSNLFCGYNPVRTMNVSAFVGGGVNVGFSNDEANDIAAKGYNMTYLWDGTKVRPVGKAGVAVDFRLSDAVALGIEGNANILSDKYNSKKAGNADWYFNVLAGLKINLGKSYEKVAAPAPEPVVVEPEPEPVVEPAPVVEEVKEEEAAPVAEEKKKPGRKPGSKNKTTVKEEKKEESVTEVYLQFGPGESSLQTVVDRIRAEYVEQGHRVSSIKSLKVYLKPEERSAYYVINEKVAGRVDLF